MYHFASAVVYPSVYEGYGLPVFEAMCCSAVVLASRVTSLPEVLGDAGTLFDPYSAESIAAAVLGAVTLSPDDASAYRRRCRLRAELLLARRAAQAPLPGLPLAEMVLA
jgi:glycosyltransferase involved in cell wall biosynthesis